MLGLLTCAAANRAISCNRRRHLIVDGAPAILHSKAEHQRAERVSAELKRRGKGRGKGKDKDEKGGKTE